MFSGDHPGGNPVHPKFPMPICVMAAGAGLTAVLHLEQYDVALLSHVDPGFPGIILPDFANVEITHVVGKSLMVAAVVMAETLLAENEFALKNGYKINENGRSWPVPWPMGRRRLLEAVR